MRHKPQPWWPFRDFLSATPREEHRHQLRGQEFSCQCSLSYHAAWVFQCRLGHSQPNLKETESNTCQERITGDQRFLAHSAGRRGPEGCRKGQSERFECAGIRTWHLQQPHWHHTLKFFHLKQETHNHHLQLEKNTNTKTIVNLSWSDSGDDPLGLPF